jgi:3-oxoacyl-[acyl-carrier protein] reductase
MNTGLKGKVALVAGASEGMARAAAQTFAAEGCTVAICSRTEEKIQQAAAEIRKATGAEVFAQQLDVTYGAGVEKFVADIVKKYGRVDICVANAAGPPAKFFLQTSAEEWQQAFNMNFMSVVHLAREVLPHMQKNRWGRMITITSISVRQPIPDLILSSAIRPAVVGLVKSLAAEFGKDNITVNNVAPGYTATQRLTSLAASRAKAAGVEEKDIYDKWAAEIPMKRLAEPQEIADAIVWLASERAAYITGQTILVDGGNYKGM